MFNKALLRASASALVLVGLACALPAAAEDAAPEDGKEVIVLGKRVIRESAGATGLDLSLRQTPQSVTVVTAQQIEQFALTDANQLLATLPGINVESVETDRTYYNSRGFDIINFQVDGIGQPLDWGLQTGAFDVALFDRVEAIRGANGMMTGTGNPSATINYIRKRPTKDFRAGVSAGYGSWNNLRLTGDVSGPLNADATVTGRLVYARTESDSYLDYYHVDRNVYSGILSWDITPKLNATAGYSQQDNLVDGNNWGALPLLWSDGTPIDYDVSATTAAPWTYWDTHNRIGFAELSYEFDSGWTVKGVFTHRDYDDNAKLLYAYGNPDKTTGLGVGGMSGLYPGELTQDMFDLIANGKVNLFGRDHQIVVGYNTSKSTSMKWEAFADLFDYPAYQGTAIVTPAEPSFPDAYLAEEIENKLSRAYAAIHLNVTDKFKGIIGVNAIDLDTNGYSYGNAQVRSEQKVSPYVGAIYDLNTNMTLYASYSDIFDPQSENDITRNRLAPAEGKSFEAGVKSEWLDRRLYATAAVFKSEQYNLAEFAGNIPGSLDSYYIGVDTFVEGYEFEIAGRITPEWTVNGGWTDLSIKDKDGNEARTYVPRKTLKLSTSYNLPYRDARLGAALRWQGDTSTIDIGQTFTQEAYSVIDLNASFKVIDGLRASLNIKNAFDKKYYGSVMWNQVFYAPPRSIMVTLDYDF